MTATLAATVPAFRPGIGVDTRSVVIFSLVSVVIAALIAWAAWRRDGGVVSVLVVGLGMALTKAVTSAMWTTPGVYVLPGGAEVSRWSDADLAAVAAGQVVAEIEIDWHLEVLSPERLPTFLGPGGEYTVPAEQEVFVLTEGVLSGEQRWCAVNIADGGHGSLMLSVTC